MRLQVNSGLAGHVCLSANHAEHALRMPGEMFRAKPSVPFMNCVTCLCINSSIAQSQSDDACPKGRQTRAQDKFISQPFGDRNFCYLSCRVGRMMHGCGVPWETWSYRMPITTRLGRDLGPAVLVPSALWPELLTAAKIGPR